MALFIFLSDLWHICRYLQIIELADKYLCPLIIFKGILILLAKSTASSCARMDGVRDSDISLCHHMNLPVLHCKQRFSIRVSRDVYTQIPFKGTVAVESSPSTSQHRQSIGFSLCNFRSRESNIKHKRCLPIATQREQDFSYFSYGQNVFDLF